MQLMLRDMFPKLLASSSNSDLTENTQSLSSAFWFTAHEGKTLMKRQKKIPFHFEHPWTDSTPSQAIPSVQGKANKSKRKTHKKKTHKHRISETKYTSEDWMMAARSFFRAPNPTIPIKWR